MARNDSVEFAVSEAKAMAEPLPEPPQALDDTALAYWPAVIESKRRTAWTQSDLIQACQLCRDYAAVEALNADLERDGQVLTAPSGRKYPNPAANLLDKAQRRALAIAKALQIHAIGTSGKTENQPKKNEAARDLAGKLATVSTLIARPNQ